MKRYFFTILILAAIIAVPLLLRKPAEEHSTTARQLVIITPHNEAIRYEFERAFRQYHFERTGEEVSIDWRTIGGASEIVRYIRSTFIGNFQHDWREVHPDEPWDDRTASAVFDYRTTAESNPVAARARADFLASNTSIGIDIFFGGGQYDMNSLTRAGITVPAGVRERHPEWFAGDAPIMAPGGGGEVWYDPQDRYYATCFACFGIVSNRDRLASLGFDDDQIAHFGSSWHDLADPRLYHAVGVADPTQSGSIVKCFEMLIQREMQDTIAALCPNGEAPSAEQLNIAWRKAMTLIKQIGGNAAYLTFSASKVPVDAAAGQIAAGMCIDFYGRSQAEWEAAHVGRRTLEYRTPAAGSSVSADPIALLRGAPDRALAEEFIDFVLSPTAQRLYSRYAGSDGGPAQYTLYRLPCRRDLYTPAERAVASFGDEDPFTLAANFTYRGEWTGRLFTLMRLLVKVMIIDCGPELRACWGEIIAHGGLEKLTDEQRAAFEALPFEHSAAAHVLDASNTPEKQAELLRSWIEFFRQNYRAAMP
jgi:iron(III) transport system substrate-binding protein